MAGQNTDPRTVEGFGEEWVTYDQTRRAPADLLQTFDRYFSLFPWDSLPPDAVGLDAGSGSGRWAAIVAPRVGRLLLVDASHRANRVADRAVARHPNAVVVTAAIGNLPIPDASMDFGYSLGVLHHTPDPAAGIADCVRTLRPGAPFLVYLYYAIEDRPGWFRRLWKLSDQLRLRIAHLPRRLRHAVCTTIAFTVYLPLARLAPAVERVGVRHAPLGAYRDKPFSVMRTDAYDRFATAVEHRFTRDEVVALMTGAGLVDIEVRDGEPYWCAIGRRAPSD